jgi:hypothetical protein
MRDNSDIRFLEIKTEILMRGRFYLQLIWVVLFGAFLFISAPIVFRAVFENKIGPVDPNHSIDNYLQGLTGVTNGSARFSEALAALETNKPLIVFVNAESSPSSFLGMLVSYLSWPRDARIINVHTTGVDRELAMIKPASIAGVVFCSVTAPSWILGGTRFGRNIFVVPASSLSPSR